MRAIPALGLVFIGALIAVIAVLINPVQAQVPSKYVEGTHYQRIATPIKTRKDDKIEVMEVFWYGCPHCNQFRPVFEAWKKQQGADVATDHSPAMWSKPMIVHAHMFYTAKAFRLQEKMHKEIFDAMHLNKNRLISKEKIYTLFEKHGISEEDFNKTFDSFGIKSQVQQASARARGYGITGTPEVIVNGKYRISGRMAGSQGDMLKVASYLIEKERRENTL
jgi:thiol:disulfide interchange protein DsbA